MALINQYFSTLPSVRFAFKSGVIAHFVNGRYRTKDADEIAELDAEIKKGNNPYLYIKTDAEKADPAMDDPLIGLKKKIIEDYLKEQASKELASKGVASKEAIVTGPADSVSIPVVKPASSDTFIPVAASKK